MSNVYLDASALLRRYLQRTGSEVVDALLASAASLATAAITRVEVAASLTRLEAGGAISKAGLRHTIQQLESDLGYMTIVPINTVVLDRAYVLGQSCKLRGFDAIHLAAAEIWRSAAGNLPIEFATFDERLWTAAASEGFAAWPEELAQFK